MRSRSHHAPRPSTPPAERPGLRPDRRRGWRSVTYEFPRHRRVKPELPRPEPHQPNRATTDERPPTLSRTFVALCDELALALQAGGRTAGGGGALELGRLVRADPA